MSCPDPPSVANGYISSNSGTSVTYACNDGFGLSGYAEVLCSGGAWGTLPYCYTRWNRNNNNFVAYEASSIVEKEEDTPEYIIYGVYGAVALCVLLLLAGMLLCWLHQCGCYDGPAVGFGGNYVYTDRRCCYWGDLNVNCCNFKCSCCKRRCCRYVRKKSHGKVHFQTSPTPEQVAILKLQMKKKKKRKFRPIPYCLRAGRCLLACLLCCCRWKRRKAKLAKQPELAEEENLLNVAAVVPEPPPKQDEESKIIEVKPVEEKKEDEKPKVVKEKAMIFPKKPTEPEPEPEKKKEKEKEKEPVGPPLMVIRAPPPKPKKKKKVPPKPTQGFESVPAPDFVNIVESTQNPFGNVDVKPSKRAEMSKTTANDGQNSFPMGKGNKVSTGPSANIVETHLTYEKHLNKKVAKWSDMSDDEVWKTQPQQKLFSPEAPIKTRKTIAEMIPLSSLFKISETSKPKKTKTKPEKKRKADEGEEFSLPNVGIKQTRVK